MRYLSTRDKSISRTFEEALFAGYAPGGGLFVPQHLPDVTRLDLEAWTSLSFPELAFVVLCNFIPSDEVSSDDLRSICQRSFYDGFDAAGGSVVPVVKVGSLYVSELFHGPTFCFKDLGMRAVINLLSHFTTKRRRQTTLLVATTGDTGPAAAQAVCDTKNPNLRIVVHFPLGQISNFQRKQLTTLQSPNIKIVSFEGGGDDMDRPIKDILTDPHPSDEGGNHVYCGVNSYNIGRPLMQMIHAIWTYLRVVEQVNGTIGVTVVDFILPTGAMGNMTGTYMAKKMGVPIGMMCAGVNINDITHRVVQTGKFHREETMKMTLSEALNIQVPYNFERILFYLTQSNDKLVKEWMSTMDLENKIDLDQSWLHKLQAEFQSARITDEDVCSEIKGAKEDHNYYIDPHTAVAFAAARKLGYRGSQYQRSPQVQVAAIFATASPCKFEEAVTMAIGSKGWGEYLKEGFPIGGKNIDRRKEIPPIAFRNKEGMNLAQVQLQWKEMALSIIQNMDGA